MKTKEVKERSKERERERERERVVVEIASIGCIDAASCEVIDTR